MMQLQWTERAAKELQKLPKATGVRIVNKMEWYVQQEDPLGFAEPLHNAPVGEVRFRVGDYRVLCDVEHDIVSVLSALTVRKQDHAYD